MPIKIANRPLSRRLKEYRERYAISQLDLALKTDLSDTEISNIEVGKVKNPSIETLTKIAEALELNHYEAADLKGDNLYPPKNRRVK